MDELERVELANIDHALTRIRNGIFGICDECGAKIEDKRLKALPYATTCMACASERNN